jgi:integrase
MAVYQPTYRDKRTGETKTSKVWWYEFTFADKRVRESAKTTRKTLALEAEKNRRLELERAIVGYSSENRKDRIRSVRDVVDAYLDAYELTHRAKSIMFARGRLSHVTRLLGSLLLPDVTEHAIHGYMKTRSTEGASGRTVNMEIGELSRAIGKHWSALWPKVRRMEERSEVGRALSAEEEERLLAAVDGQRSPNRSKTLSTFLRVALLTGMRSGEIAGLSWGQIDFERRIVTVGKSKTAAGTGRQIPMNADLYAVLVTHAEWFADRFGGIKPEWYLFPFGKPTPSDPTRPITDVTGAWHALRKRAKVNCRLHDLRHTVATKMAEAGVPESTMLALMGHMSRKMLETYSHVRMAAKRDAVEALSMARRRPASDGVPKVSPKVSDEAIVQ